MSVDPLRLSAGSSPGGATVLISAADAGIDVGAPIVVDLLGRGPSSHAYDTAEARAGQLVGRATLALADGSVVEVTDTWSLDAARGDTVNLARHADLAVAGSAEGVRIALAARTSSVAAREQEWQFFLPGTLYNRNDNDHDGVEDYLGTYSQDLRDDKNGVLGALAYDPSSGTAFSISRSGPPAFDSPVTRRDLERRYFVQRTDIGSTGLAPRGDQVELRASWPFAEEHSFSLDTAGTGWAAYAPLSVGTLVDVTYQLRVAPAPNLTEAIWRFFEHQRAVLRTSRPTPPVTLEESVQHRQLLTQLYYRRWTREENPREPAGYLVHFSPVAG